VRDDGAAAERTVRRTEGRELTRSERRLSPLVRVLREDLDGFAGVLRRVLERSVETPATIRVCREA
jgi:hypothetical protein